MRLQPGKLGAPHARGIQRRKNHAVVGVTGRLDEFGDFVLAQDCGQPIGQLRVDQVEIPIRAAQHLHEEEAQRRDPPGHCLRRQLPLVEQIQLKLTHVFLREDIGTSLEMAGEILNREQVKSNGFFGIIVMLEFLQHPLS